MRAAKQSKIFTAAMKKRNLTLSELAHAADIDAGTISRYRTGARAIGVANAEKLAPILGLTVTMLLYGREA